MFLDGPLNKPERWYTMGKRIVTLVMVWCCVTALSGCNTLRGAGKDVERVGEEIQKSTQ